MIILDYFGRLGDFKQMSNTVIPERIPEAPVRGVASIVSFLVFVGLLLSIVLELPLIATGLAGLLCLDFTLRAAGRPALSPLAALSRRLQGRIFSFKPRLITAKPKRFAAGIGAVMTALAAAAGFLGLPAVLYGLLAVLWLFSFLEAAFRFCAGCKIFALLVKLGLLRDDVCQDCVYPGGEGI